VHKNKAIFFENPQLGKYTSKIHEVLQEIRQYYDKSKVKVLDFFSHSHPPQKFK